MSNTKIIGPKHYPLLAIDCSTSHREISIQPSPKAPSFSLRQDQRASGDDLITPVTTISDQAGIKVSQIASILLGSGPGSFTGLRNSAAFAAGFCCARSLPLFTVSSADVALYSAIQGQRSQILVVLVYPAAQREVLSLSYFGTESQFQPSGFSQFLGKDTEGRVAPLKSEINSNSAQFSAQRINRKNFATLFKISPSKGLTNLTDSTFTIKLVVPDLSLRDELQTEEKSLNSEVEIEFVQDLTISETMLNFVAANYGVERYNWEEISRFSPEYGQKVAAKTIEERELTKHSQPV